MKPKFSPGMNIAVKVPAHEYDKTVYFYRTIMGLKQKDVSSPEPFDSVTFAFGDKNLWVDKVAGISQAEVWLEIKTDNAAAAMKYLEEKGFVIRNEIEPLPSGFKGFWLSSPSNIIHLVTE